MRNDGCPGGDDVGEGAEVRDGPGHVEGAGLLRLAGVADLGGQQILEPGLDDVGGPTQDGGPLGHGGGSSPRSRPAPDLAARTAKSTHGWIGNVDEGRSTEPSTGSIRSKVSRDSSTTAPSTKFRTVRGVVPTSCRQASAH